MPTVKPSPDKSTDVRSLMEQAAQSTANLGWLQDYMLDWQTLRSVAIRLVVKQKQQPTKDEVAYEKLLALIEFATGKADTLEAAYAKRYSAHERLMIRLESEKDND